MRTIACYHIDDEDKEATLLGDADEYLKHQPPSVEVSREVVYVRGKNEGRRGNAVG